MTTLLAYRTTERYCSTIWQVCSWNAAGTLQSQHLQWPALFSMVLTSKDAAAGAVLGRH